MQAIQTRYLGPTDYRGSRVKASCQAGSVTLTWYDALDTEGNHDAAAFALADKLKWNTGAHGIMMRGASPDGRGNVYVFARASEIVGALDGQDVDELSECLETIRKRRISSGEST